MLILKAETVDAVESNIFEKLGQHHAQFEKKCPTLCAV
jgi:hypothetical protein